MRNVIGVGPRFKVCAFASAVVCCCLSNARAVPRGKPDPSAIRDAISASGNAANHQYVSARALSHYMRSVMDRSAGDEDGTLEELRLAALYGTEDPFPQAALASECLRRGDIRAADEAVVNALTIAPDHTPSLIVKARLELEQGNVDRAIALLKNAGSQAPASIEVPALLVDAHLSRGETRAAVSIAEKLGAAMDSDGIASQRHRVASLLDRVADALAAQGSSERAGLLLRRAVELEPENPERLVALAQFLEARGHPSDAAEVYARALGVSSDEPRFALDAARLYLKAGHRTEAAAYIAILADSARGRVPLVRLGDMFVDAGAEDEALSAYRAGAELAPGWGEPLTKAAELCERNGHFEDAAAWYRRVPPSDDSYPRAQARAQVCDLRAWAGAGRRDEAVQLARKLAGSATPDPDALDFLARDLLETKGDLTAAERDARAAVASAAGRGDLAITLGEVLLARQSPEAFEVLEKAAAALPERPIVQADLAEAALLARHPDAARAALTRLEALISKTVDDAVRVRLTSLRARIASVEVPSGEKSTLRATGGR
jgi:tetratricopeptide (TPR) repeat protein